MNAEGNESASDNWYGFLAIINVCAYIVDYCLQMRLLNDRAIECRLMIIWIAQ